MSPRLDFSAVVTIVYFQVLLLAGAWTFWRLQGTEVPTYLTTGVPADPSQPYNELPL